MIPVRAVDTAIVSFGVQRDSTFFAIVRDHTIFGRQGFHFLVAANRTRNLRGCARNPLIHSA